MWIAEYQALNQYTLHNAPLAWSTDPTVVSAGVAVTTYTSGGTYSRVYYE